MSERLIDWTFCDIDGELAIEEFIAQSKGGYYFQDIYMEGENCISGRKKATAWYGDTLKARREWFRKTGRELSQLDVFRANLVQVEGGEG